MLESLAASLKDKTLSAVVGSNWTTATSSPVSAAWLAEESPVDSSRSKTCARVKLFRLDVVEGRGATASFSSTLTAVDGLARRWREAGLVLRSRDWLAPRDRDEGVTLRFRGEQDGLALRGRDDVGLVRRWRFFSPSPVGDTDREAFRGKDAPLPDLVLRKVALSFLSVDFDDASMEPLVARSLLLSSCVRLDLLRSCFVLSASSSFLMSVSLSKEPFVKPRVLRLPPLSLDLNRGALLLF